MTQAQDTFTISNPQAFRSNLLRWCMDFEVFCYLDSCNFYTPERMKLPLPFYRRYDCVAGLGAAQVLQPGKNDHFPSIASFSKLPGWKFGYLTYDLKNETENLSSRNPDGMNAPESGFFIPEITITLKGNQASIYSKDAALIKEARNKLSSLATELPVWCRTEAGKLTGTMGRNQYVKRVQKLQEHIACGDIYEVNFCQEFFREDKSLDPFNVYSQIQKNAPAPFSAFYRNGNIWAISASMERFLCHRKGKLISQPIKGTIRRGSSPDEDRELARRLKNDPKERAENVMIVDLVRNDLNKNAIPGTVQVEELFGIYPFPQVHQMISTISAKLQSASASTRALRDAFPMGSMTGAPKLRAMELIEEYELSKRGIFSGSIGYIDPAGDYDFNVVIRTILYNASRRYLSLHAGSAITFDASASQEYEECLLKIGRLSTIATGTN